MKGEFTLTCSGYNCTCSPAIQLYIGDSMTLSFSIINKVITSIKGFDKVNYLPISGTSAKLLIETPEGVDSQESVLTAGDKITFKIPSTYTKSAGTYKMQVVLYDTDDDGTQCVMHMPPFTYEIQEPIGPFSI